MARLSLWVGSLLLLSTTCVDAVRLQSRQRRGPTVIGTTMLDEEEMAGKRPVFVDAFPNAGGTDLYIVLNFSPLFPKTASNSSKEWTQWINAMWQCAWATEDYIPMYQRQAGSQSLTTTRATIVHSTFDEAAKNVTRLHMRDLTPAKEKSETFRWFHHALILGCPIPAQSMKSDKEWFLSISARNDSVLYERKSIPVTKSTFVKPGANSVMCTMMFKEEQTAATLRPWIRFHMAQGFDQILLYVEDADPTWANEAIADMKEAENVTVVPFYFGEVSNQRAFHMQGGMENHCLYQARHRTEWLAHADIDEYFDIKVASGLGIQDYLKQTPSDTAAIMVRSQFWVDAKRESHVDLPFPCFVTCKASGYFAAGIRSKWIARPTDVNIINPHILKAKGDSQIHDADPTAEMRLNHFKECAPNMLAFSKSLDHPAQCMQAEECELDRSFRERCRGALEG